MMIFGGLVVGGVWAETSAIIGFGPGTAIIAAVIMSSCRIGCCFLAPRYVDFNRTISVLRFHYRRDCHPLACHNIMVLP